MQASQQASAAQHDQCTQASKQASAHRELGGGAAEEAGEAGDEGVERPQQQQQHVGDERGGDKGSKLPADQRLAVHELPKDAVEDGLAHVLRGSAGGGKWVSVGREEGSK